VSGSLRRAQRIVVGLIVAGVGACSLAPVDLPESDERWETAPRQTPDAAERMQLQSNKPCAFCVDGKILTEPGTRWRVLVTDDDHTLVCKPEGYEALYDSIQRGGWSEKSPIGFTFLRENRLRKDKRRQQSDSAEFDPGDSAGSGDPAETGLALRLEDKILQQDSQMEVDEAQETLEIRGTVSGFVTGCLPRVSVNSAEIPFASEGDRGRCDVAYCESDAKAEMILQGQALNARSSSVCSQLAFCKNVPLAPGKNSVEIFVAGVAGTEREELVILRGGPDISEHRRAEDTGQPELATSVARRPK